MVDDYDEVDRTALAVKYFTDSDGDVGAFYSGFRIYFVLLDEDAGYPRLRCQVYPDRTVTLDERLWLLDRLDAWNREYYVIKAYTEIGPDGVRAIGDEVLYLDQGAPPDLGAVLERIISAVCTSVSWLGDQGAPVSLPAPREPAGRRTGFLRRR